MPPHPYETVFPDVAKEDTDLMRAALAANPRPAPPPSPLRHWRTQEPASALPKAPSQTQPRAQPWRRTPPLTGPRRRKRRSRSRSRRFWRVYMR